MKKDEIFLYDWSQVFSKFHDKRMLKVQYIGLVLDKGLKTKVKAFKVLEYPKNCPAWKDDTIYPPRICIKMDFYNLDYTKASV